MENLIKLHKTQLASDRTSCRSPLANQLRLILHTAAYWLVHAVRAAIPHPQPLARAEFATIRLHRRVHAFIGSSYGAMVGLAFAAAHPEAALFRSLARVFHPQAP